MGLVLRQAHHSPDVAAVGEDLLDEGIGAAGSLQDATGPVPILDNGCVDLDRQQAAVGIGRKWRLRPWMRFPAS